MVSGQDVVTKIENLKVNTKFRPLADVVIANSGQLVRKRTAKDTDADEEITERFFDGIFLSFTLLKFLNYNQDIKLLCTHCINEKLILEIRNNDRML